MKLSRKESGQAAVGYILTLAAVAMGVAAILYNEQIRRSFSLLYTDAATRVIKSGPVGSASIRRDQEKVWGSASIPPMPAAPPYRMPPPSPPPAPPSSTASSPVPWSGGAPPATPSPPPAAGSPSGSPGSSSGSSGSGGSSSGAGTSSSPPVVPVVSGVPGVPGPTEGGMSSSSNMSSALSDGTEGGMCQAEPSGGSFF